jgi:hypothetical protein
MQATVLRKTYKKRKTPENASERRVKGLHSTSRTSDLRLTALYRACCPCHLMMCEDDLWVNLACDNAERAQKLIPRTHSLLFPPAELLDSQGPSFASNKCVLKKFLAQDPGDVGVPLNVIDKLNFAFQNAVSWTQILPNMSSIFSAVFYSSAEDSSFPSSKLWLNWPICMACFTFAF